jgi:hypothetical protein
MHLQKKPHPWSCALSSFAMALNVSSDNLTSIVGHDGGQIIFPSLPEPACRRGFHPQELIAAALTLGYMVTPFELAPALQSTPVPGSPPQLFAIDERLRKPMFEILVAGFRGVLTGLGFKCHHAVAFDKGQVFDPEGATYRFSFAECERRRFIAQCVWVVHPFGV